MVRLTYNQASEKPLDLVDLITGFPSATIKYFRQAENRFGLEAGTPIKIGIKLVRPARSSWAFADNWAGPEFRWTVDWEILMKERSHVHRKQTRFWGCAGSPEGDRAVSRIGAGRRRTLVG